MEAGRRVAGPGGKLRAFRIVNLPPLWDPRWSAFRGVYRPSAGLLAFLQRFCKKSAPPVQPFVCITIYNANECVFSCKFSCISFLVRKFCQFCRPSRVVGCACLVFAAGSRGHPPPLPVTVCPPFGIEHRPRGDSSSRPSLPLFSSGHCFPMAVSVLLRCSSALGVLLGFLVLVSALLGVVVYDTVLYCFQPRPE